VSTATLRWGQRWPPVPSATQPPPPGPVTTLRATDYTVSVSSDGRDWRVVASVVGRTECTVDVLQFAPASTRYIAVHITASLGPQTPVLDEVTASR